MPLTMAFPRAYIPSTALLRALSRSARPPCPFARRIPTQCLRGKTSKASKASKPKKEMPKENPYQKEFDEAARAAGTTAPKLPVPKAEAESYQDMLDHGLSAIRWLAETTPGKYEYVDSIESEEDFKRFKKRDAMLEENFANPDYDSTELDIMTLTDLMNHPCYRHIREDIREIRDWVANKPKEEEEIRALERKVEKEVTDMLAEPKMKVHEFFQEMIDDPEFSEVRADLIDVQSRWAESDFKVDPNEMVTAMNMLGEKLEAMPVVQRKIAERAASGDDWKADYDKEMKEYEKLVKEADEDEERERREEEEDEELEWETEGTTIRIDKLIADVERLLDAMGGQKDLKRDLRELRAEDPFEDTRYELEEGVNWERLAREVNSGIEKLKRGPDLDESDPELKAKVDKIMDDPQLFEKLSFIAEIIKERKKDITTFSGNAPDPETLPDSELTTVGNQLKVAMKDPEHRAAIRGLRVKLHPPFNVHPDVRHLNYALTLAYCGANDDIRRIIWRCYYKARNLPTLLQNIPNDSWDLIWYSQAVTWRGNQNRQAHLELLLKDLASIGKDGPPTKPVDVGKQKPQLDDPNSPMQQALRLALQAKAEFERKRAAESTLLLESGT
ncbi:hypothetical protein BCR34DRAFT_565298 [Clohesyomyces aquaticus]|uniref:Uncharacterized protein n=1 Tax=Clohesyomyces aquaticus TaxID=1231657 RepID=A0A1Y1ZNL3_9PLEO|nr:hypothetical protein BCR34DRAFT_565298 [Clohesyomyces aquaticus]